MERKIAFLEKDMVDIDAIDYKHVLYDVQMCGLPKDKAAFLSLRKRQDGSEGMWECDPVYSMKKEKNVYLQCNESNCPYKKAKNSEIIVYRVLTFDFEKASNPAVAIYIAKIFIMLCIAKGLMPEGTTYSKSGAGVHIFVPVTPFYKGIDYDDGDQLNDAVAYIVHEYYKPLYHEAVMIAKEEGYDVRKDKREHDDELIDLDGFDTSRVISVSGMLRFSIKEKDCPELKAAPFMRGWEEEPHRIECKLLTELVRKAYDEKKSVKKGTKNNAIVSKYVNIDDIALEEMTEYQQEKCEYGKQYIKNMQKGSEYKKRIKNRSKSFAGMVGSVAKEYGVKTALLLSKQLNVANGNKYEGRELQETARVLSKMTFARPGIDHSRTKETENVPQEAKKTEKVKAPPKHAQSSIDFIKKCCFKKEGGILPFSEVYRTYCEACIKKNEKPDSKETFGEILRKSFSSKVKRLNGNPPASCVLDIELKQLAVPIEKQDIQEEIIEQKAEIVLQEEPVREQDLLIWQDIKREIEMDRERERRKRIDRHKELQRVLIPV